jgi:DMSO reductase anchor subunit
MTPLPFREWPLAVFTTLAVLGAGLLTAPLVELLAGPPALAASRLLLPGMALMAAGLVVSLAHLGRPRRSPLALARVGRSRLSNEVGAAAATLAAAAFAIAFPSLSPIAPLLASLAAVAFLVTLGLVYALPGQLAWRGAATWTPVVLGLGFGTLALAAVRDGGVWTVAPVAAIVLVADASLFIARWSGVERIAGRLAFTAMRLLLVDILPAVLAIAGLPKAAAGALGLGVLADRLSFYLLAAQHTTEAEIAQVEDIIATQSRGDRDE